MKNLKFPITSSMIVRFSRKGSSGNIFVILATASDCLKEKGSHKEAEEMRQRVLSSGSYEEALSVIDEYVDLMEV